jgi:hypothetical protein
VENVLRLYGYHFDRRAFRCIYQRANRFETSSLGQLGGFSLVTDFWAVVELVLLALCVSFFSLFSASIQQDLRMMNKLASSNYYLIVCKILCCVHLRYFVGDVVNFQLLEAEVSQSVLELHVIAAARNLL